MGDNPHAEQQAANALAAQRIAEAQQPGKAAEAARLARGEK